MNLSTKIDNQGSNTVSLMNKLLELQRPVEGDDVMSISLVQECAEEKELLVNRTKKINESVPNKTHLAVNNNKLDVQLQSKDGMATQVLNSNFKDGLDIGINKITENSLRDLNYKKTPTLKLSYENANELSFDNESQKYNLLNTCDKPHFNTSCTISTSLQLKLSNNVFSELTTPDNIPKCVLENEIQEVKGDRLRSEPVNEANKELYDENCNSKSNYFQHIENSSSTLASVASESSMCSTSSSQQLIIDHPTDEKLNYKLLPPYKLSFKRKKCKIFDDKSHIKRINRVSPHNDYTLPGTSKSLLLERLTQDEIESSDKLKCISNNLTCSICKISTFKSQIKLNDHQNSCIINMSESTQISTAKRLLFLFRNNYRNKNTYFKCKICNTYHQGWHFFNHVNKKHRRFICLYCVSLFPTPEKLSVHMENIHDLEQNHISNDSFITKLKQIKKCEFTCCSCHRKFESNGLQMKDLSAELLHVCLLCDETGKHTNKCTFTKKRSKVSNLNNLTNLMPQDQKKSAEPNIKPETQLNILNPNKIAFTPSMPKQIVPKIMLRVPKEFQKCVDADISTTDTEGSDDDEEELENTEKKQSSFPTQKKDEIDKISYTDKETDDASFISCVGNLDLQLYNREKFKSTLNFSKYNIEKEDAKSTNIYFNDNILYTKECDKIVNPIQCGRDQEHSPTEHSWSPTPPASPNSHWLTPRRIPTQDDSSIKLLQNTIPSLNSNVHKYNHVITIPNTKDVSDYDELRIQEMNPNCNIYNKELTQKDCSNLSRIENIELQQNSINGKTKIQVLEYDAEAANIDTDVDYTQLADNIHVADDDVVAVDIQLDQPLDKIEVVDFIRLCLKAVYPICLYCNHARRIAVNAKSLVLHIIAKHRFTATVDSITAEELKPETFVTKLKSYLHILESEFLNSSSYCSLGKGAYTRSFNERIYECFQCRFVTSTHKELYMHNRRLHIKTSILCFMCRGNFYSFSELLCHICPGEPNKLSIFDIKYRCCLCERTNIPSPFRLMVHLRKKHHACDVCLEDCRDQSKLSSHVWKHKLHHLCYRCGIAYRNKQDITKHLYWKHGTESINCKNCLQKRWRHVYHFCVPPSSFVCEECKLCFSKAMYLEVHKRIHTGDFRYSCMDELCHEKFVSRRLLSKHMSIHHNDLTSNQNIENKQIARIDLKKDECKICIEVNDQNEQNGEYSGFNSNENLNTNVIPKIIPEISEDYSRKKKKRNKRSKECLEDLNLIAPNLSEPDSNDESGDEYRYSGADDGVKKIKRIMLSPSSESEHNMGVIDKNTTILMAGEINKLSDIWNNVIQAKNVSTHLSGESICNKIDEIDDEESLFRKSINMHVCISDHDYCKIIKPPSPKLNNVLALKFRSDNTSRNSDDFSSDSSTETSSSSDSSSCSCGSNCSCSSSASDSSSSVTSSDDSDSSSGSANSNKQKPKKKNVRKKGISSSLKSKERINTITPKIICTTDVQNGEVSNDKTETSTPPFYESDFETAESDTDEEFYDEHPQKLATELLAQKRSAITKTRLSPSHNYDVENSRPSTPSFPEGLLAFDDKRLKSKKRKKDRKSTCNKAQKLSNQRTNTSISKIPQVQRLPNRIDSSSISKNSPLNFEFQNILQPPVNNCVDLSCSRPPVKLQISHISEGSSCSEADGTLKRSKRARRPNKFYGYTSDDENMSTVLAPPLLVGMQLIKPQPPPQLTWAKEDLPTPSKSVLNNKKSRSLKSNSTSVGYGNKINQVKSCKKMKHFEHSENKFVLKGIDNTILDDSSSSKLPPIPPLKIRPSRLFTVSTHLGESENSSGNETEINISSVISPPAENGKHLLDLAPEPTRNQQIPSNYSYKTSRMQDTSMLNVFAQATHAKSSIGEPKAKDKIPPALLPNPDFTTLQYFKANNIRYPIRPPTGARLAREGEAVYCYCRCPYDEVSEMIACDGENCIIEWFHFECVGIMVAPQGKWFCAECRPKYSEELYPTKVV